MLEDISLGDPGQIGGGAGGTDRRGQNHPGQPDPALLRCDQRSITLDGRDLRDYTLDSLRGQISIVLQDVFLFYGTVRENLLFGRPDADEAR